MMARAAAFQPNWASPPGDTITDILAVRGYSFSDFARRIGTSINRAKQLAQGAAHIDHDVAHRLEQALGPSAGFWMKREQEYRSDLARLEASKKTISIHEWLAQLPIADMRRFGWIGPAVSKPDKLDACLRFFDVPDIHTWQIRYRGELSVAAFRASNTFDSNPSAVAAWLRWAEIASAQINCRPWDRDGFLSKLSALRGMSRWKDPARFLPELVGACADCGVAVIIARAPKGCRASGATRFLRPDRALIVLSFRHRSDDQFWFTLFHEAGHLLLHAKDALFLEDGSDVTSDEEAEANNFAARLLIPAEFVPELMSLRPQLKPIIRFAQKLGISPGIVVGQLQHLGQVKRNRLNGLKRRYCWNAASTLRLNP